MTLNNRPYASHSDEPYSGELWFGMFLKLVLTSPKLSLCVCSLCVCSSRHPSCLLLLFFLLLSPSLSLRLFPFCASVLLVVVAYMLTAYWRTGRGLQFLTGPPKMKCRGGGGTKNFFRPPKRAEFLFFCWKKCKKVRFYVSQGTFKKIL